MKSIYKLIWTEEAVGGLKEIIFYLENNFAEKDVKKFSEKINKIINLILANPKTFPIYDRKDNIRRAVIAKYTSVFLYS